MVEQTGSTALEHSLQSFMEERGIKDVEELAAAMQAEEPNWTYTPAIVRAVMDDPGTMSCVFVVVAGDALSSDEMQSEERAKALSRAAGEDIRARWKNSGL